jgi:hypothetical protein
MNLNPGTWQSVIRSVGRVFGGMLAYAGLISQTSVSDIVQKAVDAAPAVIQAISVLTPLGLAIWGARTHTDTAVVQTASNVQGVAEPIRIAADAPPALKALAKDDSVPNVKSEAAPPFVPSNLSQRR